MIRVFVGTSPDGHDAEAEIALERSIRSRCSMPVEIEWMRLTHDPKSPWFVGHYQTANWVTPFSGFRWNIPKACGYQGRAIYMDVDTLVITDLAELWNADMRGAAIMARECTRFCVMLIDCQKANRWPQLRQCRSHAGAVAPFPAGQNWNCLDGDGLPLHDFSMKILHFTSIDSQPHIPLARERLAKDGTAHWYDGPVRPHWRPELTALWRLEYDAALKEGYAIKPQNGPPFGFISKRKLEVYKGLRPANA